MRQRDAQAMRLGRQAVYSARPASDRRLPILLASALAVAVVRAVLARRLAGTRKVSRHVDRVEVSSKDELICRSEETLGTITE